MKNSNPHYTIPGNFVKRHIGVSETATKDMLKAIGVSDIDALIGETIPQEIRNMKMIDLPQRISEYEYLKEIKQIASTNRVWRTYMGIGYYNTITPSPILRNIFENPGWYTQYTPYQAEIAQGRLEALLNFQTVVSDLTGLPVANASLLDEGTAAAEAMSLAYHIGNKSSKEVSKNVFLVSDKIWPQTLDVLKTRALPFGIELKVESPADFEFTNDVFGAFVQYPDDNGHITDFTQLANKAHETSALFIMAADLLSLTLLKSPGEMGADICIGTTQRFGVPLGYGGPHAAFFACKDDFKRILPGRIIGVSIDADGNPAYRMALQTREQHIRREKATSNICTAQALLAIMAGMYAVYHGPEGLNEIATRIHSQASVLATELGKLGYHELNQSYFDTIQIEADPEEIRVRAEAREINFRYFENSVGIALDETATIQDLEDIIEVFAEAAGKQLKLDWDKLKAEITIPQSLKRTSSYLEHPNFKMYRSETELMRYIKKLENRDLSLTQSMIPLGSCTMKLNAATQLMPVSWEEFSQIHPFVPESQVIGYRRIVKELEAYLSEITGFSNCSLQPNSGAQGEFAGLMVIRAYHEEHGNSHRNIVLIPQSAHGTNPASAVMAGMKVVVVKCDEQGNIDIADLKTKSELHSTDLAAFMVTYPSTHGVFEENIVKVCQIIHDNGGLVYMDGANMNAQVGLTNPGTIGADVCHLNLHKTFSIPHGGGGPGMGPICVNEKLAPFLPGHPIVSTGGDKAIPAISAAPYGSTSILLISYAYIRMLGREGVTDSTKYAILNANYMKKKLNEHFEVLYEGKDGRVAHELILDFRPFKKTAQIEVEDVAKRLIDYGFHAPTVSFPVAGTMMIEPTESESQEEMDRFCRAMVAIRHEIAEIEEGNADPTNNVLKNAPHPASRLTAETWDYPYSRERAVYPLPYVKENKFWPAVSRINNPHGDRNLICTCPPIEEYETV